MKITIESSDLDTIPEMIKAAIAYAPQSAPLNHPLMIKTIERVLAATTITVTRYIDHLKSKESA